MIKIGLNPPRAQLYDRINRRVESMFAAGLMEETQALASPFRRGAHQTPRRFGLPASVCGLGREG